VDCEGFRAKDKKGGGEKDMARGLKVWEDRSAGEKEKEGPRAQKITSARVHTHTLRLDPNVGTSHPPDGYESL